MVRSPRAVPWESTLPWATLMLIQRAAAVPGRDDRGRGSACAKAVAASTSLGAGTNATASSRNACGRSASGRRQDGRPSIARPPRPRSDTPRPRKRAVSESSPRPRPLRIPNLHRRVVTQQKLFFSPVMRSAGLSRTPRDLSPQPGTVLLLRLPSGGSQCPGSGTQMALSRHLGRSQEAELRVPGRSLATVSTAV
jgi:hypothetical protein